MGVGGRISALPTGPLPPAQHPGGPRGYASMSTLTSFRATHTVYRATSLKTCSSSRHRTSTCTRVMTSEKPVARSSRRSATRPHLLAGGVGGMDSEEEGPGPSCPVQMGLQGSSPDTLNLPSGTCVDWWGLAVPSPSSLGTSSSSSCCSRGVRLTASCLGQGPGVSFPPALLGWPCSPFLSCLPHPSSGTPAVLTS